MKYNVKLDELQIGAIKLGGIEVQAEISVSELFGMKRLAKEVISELPEIIGDVRTTSVMMDNYFEEDFELDTKSQIKQMIKSHNLNKIADLIAKGEINSLEEALKAIK